MKGFVEIFKQIVDRDGWITLPEMAILCNVTNIAIRQGIYRDKYTIRRQVNTNGIGRGGKVWQIHISDPAIPTNIRRQYDRFLVDKVLNSASHAVGNKALSPFPEPSAVFTKQGQGSSSPVPVTSLLQGQAGQPDPAISFHQLSDEEIGMEIISRLPDYQREKFYDNYNLLKEFEGLHGYSLEQSVASYNYRHPGGHTSVRKIRWLRQKYAEQGIYGLIPQWGKSAGKTRVRDDWFEYFKALYLKEGAPSLLSCWRVTLGFTSRLEAGITLEDFPSPNSFLRRLKKDMPESSIYIARYGEQAWNRKYANYIDRDYSTILSGECYVSDHAQVDMAVMLPNGKPCFPWITAWRDFKSGKWLGWVHHPEAPNSDHVFQSFYYAVNKWGLPTDVYIDNGKDYRCRDFAGGRKYHKVTVDKAKTISMLALLNIVPHFALPYNAQSKTIERDFLKNKEWFSKHMPGYRGGHVKERPEKLKSEIKTGQILAWDEYVRFMDEFISTILNKMPSQGKVLQGMSPDELWNKEVREIRKVSRDALKLFCMRTSKPLKIGKNGVYDSEAGQFYWGEWMSGRTGQYVYLRRDPKAWQEAWCFNESDDFIGIAVMGAMTAPALARTDVEKAELREAIAMKKRAKKITKSFIETKDAPTPEEILINMAAGVETVNKLRGYEPREREEVKVTRLANTAMDEAVQKRRIQEAGTFDLKKIMPPEPVKKKPIFQFQCDKEQWEREQRRSAL